MAAAGVETPRVDAELLLAEALDVARSRLALLDDLDVPPRFGEWVGRREAREPLQHIVGHAPFRHIEVPVGPGVFVPRPETELLVDAVLPALNGPAPVAVDLCSGSGALALALADEVPGATVYAVEREGPAAEWLRRHEGSVRIVVADVRDRVLPELLGAVDAVVCNPPYVPEGVPVSPEVRADPHQAVFAGADGLDLMSSVIDRAAELLTSGGVLAVEHDDSHSLALPRLLHADGRWDEVADHRDLAGRPRYATARRREAG